METGRNNMCPHRSLYTLGLHTNRTGHTVSCTHVSIKLCCVARTVASLVCVYNTCCATWRCLLWVDVCHSAAQPLPDNSLCLHSTAQPLSVNWALQPSNRCSAVASSPAGSHVTFAEVTRMVVPTETQVWSERQNYSTAIKAINNVLN